MTSSPAQSARLYYMTLPAPESDVPPEARWSYDGFHHAFAFSGCKEAKGNHSLWEFPKETSPKKWTLAKCHLGNSVHWHGMWTCWVLFGLPWRFPRKRSAEKVGGSPAAIYMERDSGPSRKKMVQTRTPPNIRLHENSVGGQPAWGPWLPR